MKIALTLSGFGLSALLFLAPSARANDLDCRQIYLGAPIEEHLFLCKQTKRTSFMNIYSFGHFKARLGSRNLEIDRNDSICVKAGPDSLTLAGESVKGYDIVHGKNDAYRLRIRGRLRQMRIQGLEEDRIFHKLCGSAACGTLDRDNTARVAIQDKGREIFAETFAKNYTFPDQDGRAIWDGAISAEFRFQEKNGAATLTTTFQQSSEDFMAVNGSGFQTEFACEPTE